MAEHYQEQAVLEQEAQDLMAFERRVAAWEVSFQSVAAAWASRLYLRLPS
jgi:hypothetical protein